MGKHRIVVFLLLLVLSNVGAAMSYRIDVTQSFNEGELNEGELSGMFVVSDRNSDGFYDFDEVTDIDFSYHFMNISVPDFDLETRYIYDWQSFYISSDNMLEGFGFEYQSIFFPNVSGADGSVSWLTSHLEYHFIFMSGFPVNVTFTTVYNLDSTSRFQLNSIQPISPVPIPAAAWLFGSALLGFFGFSRRKATA